MIIFSSEYAALQKDKLDICAKGGRVSFLYPQSSASSPLT